MSDGGQNIVVTASAATDANGRVCDDAPLTLQYLCPGQEFGTAFRRVRLPRNADQDQIAKVLWRDGYTIRGVDLVMTDGYELRLRLGMLGVASEEDCVDCRGPAQCVESRFDDRGPFQHIHIRRLVCLDAGCGRSWTHETDGG